MIYRCCDDKARQAAVLNNPTLNGIDYLEVSARADAGWGSGLQLHCLKPVPTNLTAGQHSDHRRRERDQRGGNVGAALKAAAA